MNTPPQLHTADGARLLPAPHAGQWLELVDAYREHSIALTNEAVVRPQITYLQQVTVLIGVAPAEVRQWHLIEVINRLGCSAGFKNYLIVSLRAFFSWVHHAHKTPANPASGLPTIPVGPDIAVDAVVPRLRAVLGTCTPRQRLILLLAACAGLHPTEIAALRTCDIDTARNTITTTTIGLPREIRTIESLIVELADREPGWVFPAAHNSERHIKAATVRRHARDVLPHTISLETLNAAYASDVYSTHPRLSAQLFAKGTP